MKKATGIYLLIIILGIGMGILAFIFQVSKILLQPQMVQFLIYTVLGLLLFGNLISYFTYHLTYRFAFDKKYNIKIYAGMLIFSIVNILFIGIFWYMALVMGLFMD